MEPNTILIVVVAGMLAYPFLFSVTLKMVADNVNIDEHPYGEYILILLTLVSSAFLLKWIPKLVEIWPNVGFSSDCGIL